MQQIHASSPGRLLGHLAAAGAVLLSLGGTGRARAADQFEFFEKKVRPVLADHCYKCHGAESGKSKGGLLLDTKEGLLRGGENGAVVVPGDPDKSRIIEAVRYANPDLQMPPKGPKLSDAQVADLVAWVKAGAPDPRVGAVAGAGPAKGVGHWAFQPPREQAPPEVRRGDWVKSPIDRFVLAKLEAAGLSPAPPADKRTLLRRATFDLTGLPPTPAEVRDFLADDSPGAFAKVVERLLASPAYGERWGRHWLDVARYADTAGDGSDYPAPLAYRYRNYVISAFNQDKPYDQFVREQIAGDLIAERDWAAGPPQAYAERVIATGYLASSKRFGYDTTNTFRHLDIADTIDVLGKSMLGLSVGCARCHDHKFDPVSTADYYALYGIFESSRYSFPGGEVYPRPEYLAPLAPPAERDRLDAERKAKLAELDRKLNEVANERAALAPQAASRGGKNFAFEQQPDGAAPGAGWSSAGANTVLAEAQSPFTHVYPPGARLRLRGGKPNDGVQQAVSPARKPLNKTLCINLDFRCVGPTDPGKAGEAGQAAGGGGGSYRFYTGQIGVGLLALEVAFGADTFSVRNGDDFQTVRKIKPGVWYNLQLEMNLQDRVYSGTVGAPGDVTRFHDIAFSPTWSGTIDGILFDGTGPGDGARPTYDIDNLAIQDVPFTPMPEGAAPPTRPTTGPASAPTAGPATAPSEKTASSDKGAAAPLAARIAALDASEAEMGRQRKDLLNRPPYDGAYGVTEDKAGDAKIQLRGDPKTPGPTVRRGFLKVLGGQQLPPECKGSGRLELAGWITDPANPLTARVMVNRIWQHHFGRGIVATPNDFGTRGTPPTHPELLDWLARRFVEQGWSIKAMHRLMMESAAYQMSGQMSGGEAPGTSRGGEPPLASRADPEDRLLWRFPRRRLEAEAIRDAMLAAAGTLDPTPGGPHPFPPAESWAYSVHNPFYGLYDTNRRSVYLMVQRQKRHPFLALFDGADPNVSTDERQATVTPSQALYLMNDPFVHAQSAALAKRVLAGAADETGRLRLAYELTQTREADADDLADAATFLRGYREAVAALGKSAEEQQAQAWSAFARVLLTDNGFLFVD